MWTAAQLIEDPARVSRLGISLGFVLALIEYFRGQRCVHRKYAIQVRLGVCVGGRCVDGEGWQGTCMPARCGGEGTAALAAVDLFSRRPASPPRPSPPHQLLLRLRTLLAGYKSLVHVPFPPGAERFNVCGDTHGQFYDTLHLFSLAGQPSPTNLYLFNGDFVDRGSFSVENGAPGGALRVRQSSHLALRCSPPAAVLTLFAWKLLLPDHVHLTRGSEEGRGRWGGRGAPAARPRAPDPRK